MDNFISLCEQLTDDIIMKEMAFGMLHGGKKVNKKQLIDILNKVNTKGNNAVSFTAITIPAQKVRIKVPRGSTKGMDINEAAKAKGAIVKVQQTIGDIGNDYQKAMQKFDPNYKAGKYNAAGIHRDPGTPAKCIKMKEKKDGTTGWYLYYAPRPRSEDRASTYWTWDDNSWTQVNSKWASKFLYDYTSAPVEVRNVSLDNLVAIKVNDAEYQVVEGMNRWNDLVSVAKPRG